MGCRTYDIPYIGKRETEFKFRLNNNCKYVNRQNATHADQYFKLSNHNFNQNIRFTLIQQLGNMNIDKNVETLWLIEHEDFWTEKLKTLH